MGTIRDTESLYAPHGQVGLAFPNIAKYYLAAQLHPWPLGVGEGGGPCRASSRSMPSELGTASSLSMSDQNLSARDCVLPVDRRTGQH